MTPPGTLHHRLPRISDARLIGLTGTTLAAGIAVAIVTTPDPLWWQLYFSRLGVFQDFSSSVFNVTLVTTGLLLIAAARRLRHSLHAHVARSHAHRTAPATLTTLTASMGAHLSGVGFVPLTLDKGLHDQAALGIVISFATALVATPTLVKGIRSELTIISVPTAAIVATGMGLLSFGVISLAAFELVAFALMFGWLLLFFRLLTRESHAPVRHRCAARRRTSRGPRSTIRSPQRWCLNSVRQRPAARPQLVARTFTRDRRALRPVWRT